MTSLFKEKSSRNVISRHIFFRESLSIKELVHSLFASQIQIEKMQHLMGLVMSMEWFLVSLLSFES